MRLFGRHPEWIVLGALVALALPGCSRHGGSTLTIGTASTSTVLAVFDPPNIVVPYADVINSYHLIIDNNSEFSPDEVAEIFNLMRAIKDDPETEKRLNLWIHLEGMQLRRDANGDFSLGTYQYNWGPTAAKIDYLTFRRKPDGKYELIKHTWSVS